MGPRPAGGVRSEPDYHEIDVLRTQRFFIPVLRSILPYESMTGRTGLAGGIEFGGAW